MNAEQPDAAALLAIARETLLDKVLPALAHDTRYQVLMIANAMAIAMRELSNDASSGDENSRVVEAQMLRGLYEHIEPLESEQPEQILQRLETRFAKELRRGDFDGGLQYAVRALLRQRLQRQLAVSNPKAILSAAPSEGAE